MKKIAIRFINRNKGSQFLFISLFSLAFAAASLGCSVSYPDGTILCTSDGECPGGLFCVDGTCRRHPTRADTVSSDASVSDGDSANAGQDGSAGADGAGGAPVDCDAAILQCEKDQCGTITDPCGRETKCPDCPQGSTCIDGKQCRSGCSGCELGGGCYGPGFANPDNECQVCSPAASVGSWSPNPNALCDDRKFCTESDQCNSDGKCDGKPRSCEDSCACTNDPCDEAQGGCIHKSTCPAQQVCDCETNKCIPGCKDGECTIDGVCYKGNTPNPTNGCQVCNAKKNSKGWTLREVGFACGGSAGNSPCAGTNTCDKAGNCVPSRVQAGKPCGDSSATVCSDPDTCDGKGNCLPNHKGTDVECESASTCKLAGYCDGNGICNAGDFDSWALCDAPRDPKCTFGSSCNPILKACFASPKPMGTLCNDRTPGVCENNDTCNAFGGCSEGGYKQRGASCGNSANACFAKQCDQSHDCVEVERDDGTSCGGETNNGCAVKQCQSGQCNEVPAAGKEGQPCGQTGGTGCAAKTCQSGKCNYVNTNTVCQAADTLCKLESKCDGKGICNYRYEASGYVCKKAKEKECVQTICNANGGCTTPSPANENGSCVGPAAALVCNKWTCVSGSCVTIPDDGTRECDGDSTTCDDQCSKGTCTPGTACVSEGDAGSGNG